MVVEPRLIDHIVAICDYHVIRRSDIARAEILIEAGIPTILDRDRLLAGGQDGKNAILKELLMRHLAYRAAVRFQIGRDEVKAAAGRVLDEMKVRLGEDGLHELLKKTKMTESELAKEIEITIRAKLFIARQIDLSVELGKKRFYERHRKLFPAEFSEEEERVVKVYRERLLDRWFRDSLGKADFRLLDKSFSVF